MAVGAYVFDGATPPPMLNIALNRERWGAGDISQLPAGMLPQMNGALNAYHAMRAYRSTRKTSEWTRSNPQAWEMVSWYLSQRMERNRGNRNE